MTTATEKFHEISRKASDVREGDVIRHLDGEPAKVARVGMHEDQFGWAYDFSFEGDRVPYAARGKEPFTVLLPMPKVGDHATLCYPSDRYPFVVADVSPSGHRIWIRPLKHRVVSGSFQTGDAVVEYEEMEDQSVGLRCCYWSPKRGRYTYGSAAISIGTVNYYQAPEV